MLLGYRHSMGLLLRAVDRVLCAAIATTTDHAHYDYAHTRLVGGVGNRVDDVRAPTASPPSGVIAKDA